MEQGENPAEPDTAKNTVPPKDDVATFRIESLLGKRSTVSRDYNGFIEQFGEVRDGRATA